MQCPICGREVEALIEGSCARCRSERAAFLTLDETIDVTQCAHCGRLESGATWRTASEDRDARLDSVVRGALTVDPRLSSEAVTVEPRWEDPKNATVLVRLAAEFQGHPVERSATARVRFKMGACPDCSREMGGYFEAIIQVRGAPGSDLKQLLPRIDETLRSRMDAFRTEGRPGAFFSRVDEIRGGRDYYAGSHEAARLLSTAVAASYGAERDESSKLVGRRDGRDLYRFTFLVRLPPYALGDFVAIADRLYKVVGFDKKTLFLLDVVRRERIRRDLGRIGPVKVVGRSADQRDALIVSRRGDDGQVMDPVSYKTHDVPLVGVPRDAKTVPVFWWNEALYLVIDPGT